MDSNSSMKSNEPVSGASPSGKDRVFRAHEIPLEWSAQYLDDRLKQSFPRHVLRISSLCKHPVLESKTALVTFDDPIPTVLEPLDKKVNRDYGLSLDENQIIFDHCLGVTTLSEPTDMSAMADILFVHGLSGHAIGSWRAPNGRCWPRDFLANDLPGVRIMSFGYEARLDSDTSTSQLSDFGRQLLEELSNLRRTPKHQKRPLFLVGHSFGGTIINWVLHELSFKKQNPEYQNTLTAIRCATFFGTPHQGMSIQFLEPKTEKRKHDAMKRTLQDLRSSSEMLRMLGDALRSLSGDVKFITCIEQKLTTAPSVGNQPQETYQAVDHGQARVYSQNEDIILIHADHREMIKFSGRGDSNYQAIVRRLEQALKDCRQIKNVQTLTVKQRNKLLNSLRTPEADKRQKAIANAYERTCEWLVGTQEYQSWRTKSERPNVDDHCLWIHGGTGSGKSTVVNHIVSHHRARYRDHLVAAFFFNAQGTELQTTAKGMYQSVLFQILESVDRIPCQVHALEEWIQGNYSTWSASDLQEIFEYIIPLLSRPIFCYIDALDECQNSDVPDVISFFERLARICAKEQTVLKTCFSGTQVVSNSGPSPQVICLEHHEGHQQAIIRYAEHKLQIGRDSYAKRVHQMLKQKSAGNFLWTKLVVELLNKVSKVDRHSLLERLHEIPANLFELYRHTLTLEVDNDQNMLLACLQQMLHADTPLSVRELHLMLLSTTQQIGPMEPRRLPASMELESFILHLCKGLVEIIHARTPVVQFIHPSVPDFLHDDEGIHQLLRTQQPLSPGVSHDRLKESCIEVIAHMTSLSRAVESDPPSDLVSYAVENVLRHANEADKHGISQVRFLESFPLADWVELVNKLSDRPRYGTNTSLLQVLADQNLLELMGALQDLQFSYLDLPMNRQFRGNTNPMVTQSQRNPTSVQHLQFQETYHLPEAPSHVYNSTPHYHKQHHVGQTWDESPHYAHVQVQQHIGYHDASHLDYEKQVFSNEQEEPFDWGDHDQGPEHGYVEGEVEEYVHDSIVDDDYYMEKCGEGDDAYNPWADMQHNYC